MSEKQLPTNPSEFGRFLRERTSGHAPGYDIAIYARPHLWLGLADAVEAKWQPIETAPKNATDILLEVPRGGQGWPTHMKIVGHWAEDLSGSEQPPFRGWFRDTGYGYQEITPAPVRWAPLPDVERR